MDNKKYEALIHIAETGSITQTAEIMGYTQSGITQMINSMERELGVRLLVRTNKGAHLTNHGETLLPYMREENRWENYIRQECDRMSGKETGTVTVGCLSSISTGWMPRIMETFASRFPAIRIHMLENEAPELERLLQSGKIDLAMMELNEKKSYVPHVLVMDEILAVLPEGHPLAGRESVSLDELSKYPFVSYSTGTSSRADQGWPEVAVGHRAKLDIMYTCKNDSTAIEMVRHNLGVTLAGKLMIQNAPEEPVCISLDPPMYRSLGIATRASEDPLPATRSFMKCAMEIIREKTQAE